MTYTNQIYSRLVGDAARAKDARTILANGNATASSAFLPDEYEALQAPARERIAPLPEAMTANRGFLENNFEGAEVVLSGICAMPMLSNRLLEPKEGAGSAQIVTAQGIETLPQKLEESVLAFIANAPPSTLPNLMKAGGIAEQRTLLIAEIGFYTNFTLDKLQRNDGGIINSDRIEDARKLLNQFFEERFLKNFLAFQRLRDLILDGKSTEPVIQIADNDPTFAPLYQAEIEKFKQDRELLGVNTAALETAAYYSSAIVRAYRNFGLLSADERAVIYEGMSNTVVPKTDNPFNSGRREAFSKQIALEGYWGDRNQDLDTPALVTSAPVTKGAKRLNSEPLEAIDPFLVPNDMNSKNFNWREFLGGESNSTDLGNNTGFALSIILPGTPVVRSLQETMLEIVDREKTKDRAVKAARREELECATDQMVEEAQRIQRAVFDNT